MALLVLLVVLQGGAVGVCWVLVKADVVSGRDVGSLWVSELMALASFTIVVSLGCLLARQPLRELLPLRSVHAGLVPPMILTMIGAHIIASEVDNLVQTVLPAPDFLIAIVESLFDEGAAGAFLALVITAPLTEEILCRGVMLNAMLRRHSPGVAIGISALLFALLHLNPWQFFMPLLAGVIFGWWCWRTRSLLPGLLGHALLNGMALLSAYIPLPFEIPGYTTELHEPIVHQPLWFDALGLLLLASGLLGTWTVLPPRPTRATTRTPSPPAAEPDDEQPPLTLFRPPPP